MFRLCFCLWFLLSSFYLPTFTLSFFQLCSTSQTKRAKNSNLFLGWLDCQANQLLSTLKTNRAKNSNLPLGWLDCQANQLLLSFCGLSGESSSGYKGWEEEMKFDPLIGGFKSGLLWVSSAPMAQYVCEYDSFCGLSGESSCGYKGWGG